jgi:hypothetical protein
MPGINTIVLVAWVAFPMAVVKVLLAGGDAGQEPPSG